MTGFVPNQLARSLRSSKAKLVAAILPTLVGPVFQESIGELHRTLEEHGFQLLIAKSGYKSDDREHLIIDALLQRRPDGIVHMGVVEVDSARRLLMNSGIPVVEAWDLTPTPIDMLVGFSHEGIGEAVAHRLAEKYKRLALISANDNRARRRGASFCRTASAMLGGSEVPCIWSEAPSTLASGRSSMAQLIEQHPEVRAVFCSSDVLAIGAMIEAGARGFTVPQDIAIMGMGNQEFAASLDPPLTTVRIDGTRVGRTAAELIIRRAGGEEVEERVIDIGFQIIDRGSA